MPLFAPLLAGATSRDRLIACAGAALGIAATAAICLSLPYGGVKLAAPLGASAVLVFAVPASPMAQPWPVVGGNIVSALIGVGVAQLDLPTAVDAGLSVGLAILAMSVLRCLHPPGGAVALTAVIGGPAVSAAGFLFPLLPVALNSILLAGLGLLFNRLSGHAYPHRSVPLPARTALVVTEEDVAGALSEIDEAFDISRSDLLRIAQGAVLHAEKRRG